MAQQTASSTHLAGEYAAYQQRYRDQPRESDRVLLDLLDEALASRPAGAEPARILDIGCHNGNLLGHIRRRFPDASLWGVDLIPEVIDACRSDRDLSGIRFDAMDVRALEIEAAADVVIVNAVLFRFNDDELDAALKGIGRSLAPNGTLLVFDFYHSFHQTLRIVEESDRHPEGLILTFRSQRDMRERLARAGFPEPVFRPFEIPIDLPQSDPVDPAPTYTVPTRDGHRLQFRGALHQPWCHVVATKE